MMLLSDSPYRNPCPPLPIKLGGFSLSDCMSAFSFEIFTSVIIDPLGVFIDPPK
jgi:hypothetical protein